MTDLAYKYVIVAMSNITSEIESKLSLTRAVTLDMLMFAEDRD